MCRSVPVLAEVVPVADCECSRCVGNPSGLDCDGGRELPVWTKGTVMALMVVKSALLGLGVVAVVWEGAMILDGMAGVVGVFMAWPNSLRFLLVWMKILDGVGSIAACPHSLSRVPVPSFSTILPDLAQLRQRRRHKSRFRKCDTCLSS